MGRPRSGTWSKCDNAALVFGLKKEPSPLNLIWRGRHLGNFPLKGNAAPVFDLEGRGRPGILSEGVGPPWYTPLKDNTALIFNLDGDFPDLVFGLEG